jgi:hypothetical protein
VNTGDPWPSLDEAEPRVLRMQAKLHQWATENPLDSWARPTNHSGFVTRSRSGPAPEHPHSVLDCRPAAPAAPATRMVVRSPQNASRACASGLATQLHARPVKGLPPGSWQPRSGHKRQPATGCHRSPTSSSARHHGVCAADRPPAASKTKRSSSEPRSRSAADAGIPPVPTRAIQLSVERYRAHHPSLIAGYRSATGHRDAGASSLFPPANSNQTRDACHRLGC